MGLFGTKKTETTETKSVAAQKAAPVKVAAKVAKKAGVKKVLDPVATEALKQEMKSRAHKILVRPLVTEKLTNLAALANQYAFAVTDKSNKIMVAQVVSALYGVTVEKVRVINVKGKAVAYGKTRGHTKSWKKAMVTLKAGEKIDIFAGV